MWVLVDAFGLDDHREGDLRRSYLRVHYARQRRMLDPVGLTSTESGCSFYDKEKNNTRSTKITQQTDRSAKKRSGRIGLQHQKKSMEKETLSLAEVCVTVEVDLFSRFRQLCSGNPI